MGLYVDSHASDGELANAVDILTIKAVQAGSTGPFSIEAIAARRQYILDVARCDSCGATRKECEHLRRTNTDKTAPAWFGCCAKGTFFGPCHHVDDKKLLDELLREIMAGKVRTVAEAYPPPVQGPKLPSYEWLLAQKVWWAPHRRQMVRIANMDKPWRFNTVRFLERKAPELHRGVGGRHMWNAPDDVWASFDNESPLEWLREQPLMRRLTHGLPHPQSRKGRELALRAIHWNTCPMRKAHPKALDRCLCIRDGRGRIVGATNDPGTAHVTGDTVMTGGHAGWISPGLPRSV